MKHQRPCFTLLELLTVITIIGILIALLLPALSYAKYMGRRAVCISNQKQLINGLTVYCSDFDAWYPYSYLPRIVPRYLEESVHDGYQELLSDYFGIAPWGPGNDNFYSQNTFLSCPETEARSPYTAGWAKQQGTSYMMFFNNTRGTSQVDFNGRVIICKKGGCTHPSNGTALHRDWSDRRGRMRRLNDAWTFKYIWKGPSRNQSPKYDILTSDALCRNGWDNTIKTYPYLTNHMRRGGHVLSSGYAGAQAILWKPKVIDMNIGRRDGSVSVFTDTVTMYNTDLEQRYNMKDIGGHGNKPSQGFLVPESLKLDE